MKKTSFKVAFLLKRTALKKSGKMPIVARITVNGQTVQFSTKMEIPENLWSVAQGRATHQCDQGREINLLLDGIRGNIANIYHEQQQRGAEVTAEKLKMLFFGCDDTQESLLTAFTRNNDEVKRLVGVDTTMSTYKKYELAKRRIVEFLKFQYNLSDIALRDLRYNFVVEYEVFLKSECHLSHNVASKMIVFLKRVVNRAFQNGTIKINPFASYQIRLTKVDRGFLTKEELSAIMTKRIDVKRLDHVRDLFLFCCFTGLSYIDVRNLTHNSIRKTAEGDLWVTTKRQKTDNPVNVLLLDVPKQIIDKYQGKLLGDKVLPVLSNQKCNSYLKELADICQINKNLTFHQRRQIKPVFCLKYSDLQMLILI